MTSRIDIIGLNGPTGDHYLEDVGDEQQHVSSSQAEINHIGEHNKMVGVKHDTDKPRFDLIPPRAEEMLAKVLTFGANKYAPGNWQHVPDAENRYIAAALRHINAHRLGEHSDPETGLSHLAHAMCCLAFVIELQEREFEAIEIQIDLDAACN